MTLIFKRFLVIGMLVSSMLMTGAGRTGAESVNALGLDDRTYFDIYFGGDDDSVTVIRNVKIADLKEIAGETFLVIQTQFLDAKRSEGLVAFRHVRAILPANSAAVEQKYLKLNAGH